MPTLQTETPELAAQDPEAPPVQATEAEENSTNQHTPENSVVLTPEEIRAALDAGAMDAAEAQCIDLSDENGFFSWLLNFLFGWLGKDESQPEPAYSGWRTSGGKINSITSMRTVCWKMARPSVWMFPSIRRTSTGTRSKRQA